MRQSKCRHPYPTSSALSITKTSPCNEHPFTPHFYIIKLGFTGVYFFSYVAPKHRLWVLVRTASCVPTINVLSKNKKNIKKYILKINIFTAVKYCCILHGRVCVRNAKLEAATAFIECPEKNTVCPLHTLKCKVMISI